MANANSSSSKKAQKHGKSTQAVITEGDLAEASKVMRDIFRLPDEQRAMLMQLADGMANKPPKLEQPETPEVPTMHVIPAWLDDKLCGGSPMMRGGSIPDILTQMHAMLEVLSDAVMAPDGVSPQGAWLTIRTVQDAIDRLIQHANKNPLSMPKPEKRKAVSHA